MSNITRAYNMLDYRFVSAWLRIDGSGFNLFLLIDKSSRKGMIIIIMMIMVKMMPITILINANNNNDNNNNYIYNYILHT